MLDPTTVVVTPDPGQAWSDSAAEHIVRGLKNNLPAYRVLVFSEGGAIHDFRDDDEANRLAMELHDRIESLMAVPA